MEETIKKIKLASSDWRKKYPTSDMTPWDTFCLEVKTRHDGSKYFAFNPANQRHLKHSINNSTEDFENWLNGKVVEGGIIKSQEAWDELCWICTIGSEAFFIGYDLHNFNGFKPQFLLAPGQLFVDEEGKKIVGKGLPKRKMQVVEDGQKIMTPQLVEVVEKHIKFLYLHDMEEQLSPVRGRTLFNVKVRSECWEEVYGFMFALRCLGLETHLNGASNTPKVRENFAWWRELLQLEAKWDLWVKKGIGYSPWVRNKKSTYGSQS